VSWNKVSQDITHQAMTISAVEDSLAITELRFEHRGDALGIGTAEPRLSWIITTAAEGWRQSGYAIEAYTTEDQLYDQTGLIASDESVLVPWPFVPLQSRERRLMRVRVWGADGEVSAWSALYPLEVGLLHADDWTARFVTPDWDEDTSKPQPAPLLRREFDVRAGVTRARLYVTALGVYEAEINGAVVGDHVLAPGWTSYDHRLLPLRLCRLPPVVAPRSGGRAAREGRRALLRARRH
jgi:alpha-L-rhamnosidase